MENEKNVEKKVYETPVVTKVEFDASDRITASGCFMGNKKNDMCMTYD